MAYLSPEESFDILKDRVVSTVSGMFPVKGKKHSLELRNVQVKDNLGIDDIRSQKDAKMKGRTWSVPVEGTAVLRDLQTGKVIDQQKMNLLSLPKPTRRYSSIIDGQEYQMDNQWRLKSGVYARVKDNGELAADVNLKQGRNFNLGFDPQSRSFNMKYGTSNIPLRPLLREMGVSSEELDQRWGKEIAQANAANREKAVLKFYKASTGEKTDSVDTARQHLFDTFQGSELLPETTKETLGKAYTQVTGPALMDSATKLLHISQGKAAPDKRDSLQFKELHSMEDFVEERLKKGTSDIMRRIGNTLDKKTKVRDVIGPEILNRPIKSMYGTSRLAGIPEQTNPLEMVSGQVKTTITGEGGIKSAHGISEDAKLIDASHLGYLDPIHTPEGASTGVTLRLPIGAKKRGNAVTMKLYNMKTGRMEDVSPDKALKSNVLLPDQVRWQGGKPVPIGSRLKISGPGNEVITGGMKDAQYAMRDPMQMFSMSSNLVPFIAADHPNRSTMAGRHMEQAISLKHRQAPLVQSRAGKNTFEEVMGSFAGHTAPVDGIVHKVKKDGIVIKDGFGKLHERQIYDHFPLNADKTFMHSQATVKAGDRVRKGQSVADTNFTRGGLLALGTNLQTGYMPYKGLNYEDGVVISESAADKLASEHLHRKTLSVDKGHILSKKKYLAYVPDAMNRLQADKLDDDGVAMPGQMIAPGDPLIAALRERTVTSEDRELSRIHKSLVKPYTDSSVKWESDYPGVVTQVVKRGKQTQVHIKTLERAEIGDKIAGRHGNKGIITKIIPDSDMPQIAGGRKLDLLMNPTGVPGRTNLGQILETAAGKIAEKTGKPYVIKNFLPGDDLHAKVTTDMKKYGLTDKEAITDPLSGRVMGRALVGPQHIFKLKHQVEKKMVARAGGPGYAYDQNMIPKGGGPHGAQALGTLGLYSMLAHGAKHNLREMQTLKSDASQGDAFWAALQTGEPLPAPRSTFAYKKFNSYLNAMGVNTKKEGNNLTLIPFTDKQVLSMSNGEIKDGGRMVRAKDLKPEKGGLFDPTVTGGMEGTKWSHMKLPEPFPNPLFERSIQSLVGITGKDFGAIMDGKKGIDAKTGKLTIDLDNSLVGGKAISHALGKIDVDTALKGAMDQLNNAGLKGSRLDQVNKKIKYLKALKSAGITAKDAYTMNVVPVLPPSMRPISARPNGDLNTDDLNHMYKGISLSTKQLRDMSKLLPEEERSEIRASVYDGLKSLTGIGGTMNRDYRGILDIIGGKRPDVTGGRGSGAKLGSPKYGYFQKKLVHRKQDLSMRSTIIPEPAMGLDEVGLPRKAALELYKPFVVREIRGLTGASPLQAQKMIREGGEQVNRALERVVEERPVLLKRDPVLHKHGIQAFKPRIVGGKAVQIHPLVTSGFNADFDGDAMAAFVPVSPEAVKEANRMMPSNNLFSPSTGGIMYSPTLESQLGLYGISKIDKRTNKSFKDIKELESGIRKGEIGYNDQVKVGGINSGVGRFMIAGALPPAMRKGILSSKAPLDGKAQRALLTTIAKDHKNDYGESVNKLKDLGNDWATNTAFSVGMEDIMPERGIRTAALGRADREAAADRSRGQTKAIMAYDRATQELHRKIDGLSEKNSALVTMYRAGIKPNKDTLRQIKMAPMLISNAKGEVIKTPVRRSYSEGLDVADYWTSMSGSRKGIIQKVQSVSEPGYISKQVMNSVMNNLVIDEDCGTDRGISLPLDEKDILDRHLAADTKAGRRMFQAGTLITPDIRSSLRNNKVSRVQVRSPLKCAHGPGVCKKCYGLNEEGQLPEVGTNVGVHAGQAIGERATQLAMKAFHTGGTAATKTQLVDDFSRVKDMLRFPQTLRGSATLSTMAGRVDKIQKDPAGGTNVFVAGERHYVPQTLGAPMYGGKTLRTGMQVRRGMPLSLGPVNPHQMLPLTGIDQVQNHLADELHSVYGKEGIRRRHSEMVVKALTNLTKIDDPGGHKQYIRGDYAPTSAVSNLNRKYKDFDPIIHQPILKGVDVLPMEMQEDWIAKLNHQDLKRTVLDAAQQGWTSQLHGMHPIPPVVFGAEFGQWEPGEY